MNRHNGQYNQHGQASQPNQVSQPNVNLLFYSQRCETCRNLLILLKNENLINNFKLVCVDNNLSKFPQDMMVPTMILVNINKPLVAQEAFEWVKQIKFIRQQQLIDANKIIIQSSNTTAVTKGPIGYDNEIMSGISDTFALTEKDIALPHAYFGIGEEDKNVIFTAPIDKDKINKKNQLNLIKDLESKRTQQDTNFNTEMKKEQINAVMNATNNVNNNVNNKMDDNQQMLQQQMLQQQMLQQQMLQQQMLQQQMLQQQNNIGNNIGNNIRNKY